MQSQSYFYGICTEKATIQLQVVSECLIQSQFNAVSLALGLSSFQVGISNISSGFHWYKKVPFIWRSASDGLLPIKISTVKGEPFPDIHSP